MVIYSKRVASKVDLYAIVIKQCVQYVAFYGLHAYSIYCIVQYYCMKRRRSTKFSLQTYL